MKLLACQKIKLLLRCPLEFPVLVINSGFSNRIPFSVVLLRFNSGSSNPEVSVFERSTPLISSHCYTMHREGQRTVEMASSSHTQSKQTVNSVTRSKLVTYSEPQALIFHHTVAAGFYTVKQPEYVYTQSKQEQGVHLMELFSPRGKSVGDSCLSGQLWWQTGMQDTNNDMTYFTFHFIFVLFPEI